MQHRESMQSPHKRPQPTTRHHSANDDTGAPPQADSCFYGVWCCSALNWKLPQPDGKWLLASQHLMPAFLQTREELGLLSSWVLKVVQNWSWNCTSLVKSLVQVWASYTSSFTSSFPTCKRPYKPVTLQSYRLVSNENKTLWVSKNMEPG